MKHKLLAAAAALAFVATGVAAQAQDYPKPKEQPAPTEKMGHKAPEARKAVQMERHQPKARAHVQGEAPKPGVAPKAAQSERKEAPRAAQTERKEVPRAAQGQSNQGAMQRGAQNRVGRAAQAPGQVRVMGNVRLSSEHAVQVSQTLRREARPIQGNVDIRIGARTPDWVDIRPLPEDIIAIAPEYRGYDYFIDSNDEIVFVAPESHEIVGAIEYEGRAASEDATQLPAARPCPTEY